MNPETEKILSSLRVFQQNYCITSNADPDTDLHNLIEKVAHHIALEKPQGDMKQDWEYAEQITAEWFSLPIHDGCIVLENVEKFLDAIKWKQEQVESKDWFDAIDSMAKEIVENLA